ncbi:hypothetical protein [Halalkalicoccus sp. NIPERK01]|uniref:hypothetical protein n=1 Tax=Halalkalicoccus sp. NIPERK01 TaxID=3053469 RepID=UPI00256EDAFF|nr:hypothetical protein [Halalkalicoccus sp. NIPERK01]MDL5362952.1 hypothetical protein [Halalkalicoccus sp. NIPERK01]
MVDISEIVQWGGWIIGLLSGAIVIYKYYLKRPYIFVDVDVLGEPDQAEQTPILFNVVNDGRKYAEDVFIELEFEGMNILHVNDTDTSSQLLTEKMFGTFAEYNQIIHPKTEVFSFDEENGLTVDEEDVSHINWIMFQINDIIYSKIGLQFTTRIGEFTDDSATITYAVACRSHEPREGTIELKRDGDTVIIESTKPSLRRRIKRRMNELF